MECNKEEALRAKQVAENHMLVNDFSRALRLAQKAQRLFPELENISQLLAICEVHCSAERRLGSDKDWYGILQIEQSADDNTIKKQYRKLALLLHPDKNKLAGSEAAFKLIGEANMILSDRGKRSLYDLKLKNLATKRQLQKPPPPPPDQSKEKSSVVKSEAASRKSGNASHVKLSDSNGVRKGEATFWTMCPKCRYRFEYYKSCLGQALLCQKCRTAFQAYECRQETGAASSSERGPGAAKKNTSNGGFPEVTTQKGSGSTPFKAYECRQETGAASSSEGGPVAAKKNTSNGGFAKVTTQKGSGIPPYTPSKERCQEVLSKAKVSTDGGGSSKNQVGVKGNANEGTEKDDRGRMPKADARKVEGDLRTGKRKRGRSDYSVDSGKTSGEVSGEVSSENGGSTGQSGFGPNPDHPTRRSSRQKQQVSYREDADYGDKDDLLAPKKSRSSSAGEDESSMQKDVGRSVPAGGENDEKPADVRNSASTSEVSEAEPPNVLDIPEAEFSDFDKYKQQNCFAVNQVWAIYDEPEGMPRYYAKVRKVFSGGFKLRITWFEAEPDGDNQDEVNWCNENLPIACGRYVLGDNQETEDRLMFSHQIICVSGVGRKTTFMVYPRKGETWALFRDWDTKWISEPEKHSTFKYEFVEVLSDFSEEESITVACLVKVKGFVCLFQRTRASSFQIPRRELFRFSHRIPSFRLTGRERHGVPEGSFELDPAGLPSEVTAASVGNLTNSSDFKDENRPPKGSEKVSSPKKPGKSNLEGEPSLARRSPRGSSKLPQTNIYSDATVVQSRDMKAAEKDTERSTSLNTPTKHHRKGPGPDTLPVRKSPRGVQPSK